MPPATAPTASPTALNLYNSPEVQERLSYLWARWLDEREYEDWEDYADVMKGLAEEHPGVTFVKAHKRPFGFTAKVEDDEQWQYQLSVTATRWRMRMVKQ